MGPTVTGAGGSAPCSMQYITLIGYIHLDSIGNRQAAGNDQSWGHGPDAEPPPGLMLSGQLLMWPRHHLGGLLRDFTAPQVAGRGDSRRWPQAERESSPGPLQALPMKISASRF